MSYKLKSSIGKKVGFNNNNRFSEPHDFLPTPTMKMEELYAENRKEKHNFFYGGNNPLYTFKMVKNAQMFSRKSHGFYSKHKNEMLQEDDKGFVIIKV